MWGSAGRYIRVLSGSHPFLKYEPKLVSFALG